MRLVHRITVGPDERARGRRKACDGTALPRDAVDETVNRASRELKLPKDHTVLTADTLGSKLEKVMLAV